MRVSPIGKYTGFGCARSVRPVIQTSLKRTQTLPDEALVQIFPKFYSQDTAIAIAVGQE